MTHWPGPAARFDRPPRRAVARPLRGALPARSDAAPEPCLDVDRLPPGWLAEARPRRDGPAPAALRRAIEILLAVLVLALAAPLLAAAALSARLDGAGPVLARVPRVGRRGRPFTLYRLRVRAGGLGRLLRLCRIEDVPQLVNVLKGEMALVGPRPEAPEAAAEHARWIVRWRDREAVRPGVTGWAQVHQAVTHLDRGGSLAQARRMLGYDLYYVRHQSLGLDLRILLATLRVVLLQEEAR
jgi:lipopolysaccharide/colanic/teichoic acid biosynthesis glycosyltransferase